MSPPRFPDPHFVTANGIRLAVYEEGQGFPVLLCHGFPELAYSWRHQLPALAAAGFRAIAPDQRGYGRSERPQPVEAYGIHSLCGDLVGLLDALDLERAVFCGHDWGGLVVWSAALLHPDRVAGVIGVNTPFLPRPPTPPVELLRRAFGEDHYIVHFQKGPEADAALARDVRRTFEVMMRTDVERATREQRMQERPTLSLMGLLVADPLPGKPLLEPEELEVFVQAYEQTGFTGGINWYRNLDRNWETTANLVQHVDVPGLMIVAEHDLALPPALAEGMERYVPDLEKHLIRECGHWTQQERPFETNRILVDWLQRRFGG
jgi:pimeloyl-ACP methyl ester carboxylesterase